MIKVKRIMVLLLALILVVSLVACSSGSGDPEPADSGSAPVVVPTDGASAGGDSGTAGEAAPVAELEQLLASRTDQKPEFTYENDPVDAKTIMEGKRIFMIPHNSSIPFQMGILGLMRDLFAEMGAEGFIYENQGLPDEWNTGIQMAINQDYDFVMLFGGVDPGLVASGYELLKEAGIPLMTSHFSKAGTELDTADWHFGVDFDITGDLLAAWTIVNAGADAKVAVLTEYGSQAGPLINEGIQRTFDKYAPDASLEFITVEINDWATKAQAETTNAIQRTPDLDYIIPIYDSMEQYVVPGIELAGATGKVKTISYNGTPFVLDLVREGKVEMIVGESLQWLAYASVDTIIRAFDGNTAQIDEKVPHYLFTSNNVEDAGVPAEYGLGYGDACETGYRALWGLD